MTIKLGVISAAKEAHLRYWRKILARDASRGRGAIQELEHFKEFSGPRPFCAYGLIDRSFCKTWLNTMLDGVAGEPAVQSSLADTQNLGARLLIKFNHFGYLEHQSTDAGIARAKARSEFPTLDEAFAAFETMPDMNLRHRRDRAFYAVLMLSALDPKSAIKLRLEHIKLAQRYILVDVTSFGTTRNPATKLDLLPVDDVYLDCLSDWMVELGGKFQFGPSDPLFPKITEYPIDIKDYFPMAMPQHEPLSGTREIRREIQSAFFETSLPMFQLESLQNTVAPLCKDTRLTLKWRRPGFRDVPLSHNRAQD